VKRLSFAIAAAAAFLALAVPIASAATFDNIDTVNTLQQDAAFVGHPFDANSNAVTLVAVDNSISKFCRAEFAGSGYQRPGGFCDVIKAYHKTPTGDGNVKQIENPCPSGEIPTDYGPPPVCIPAVPI
jgi:hypothetical protein